MKRNRILDAILLLLKVVLGVLTALPLVYFSYLLVDGHLFDMAHLGEPGYHSGTGLYVFASHLVLLGMNLILVILGILGWVTAAKCKRSTKAFRVLTFAPLGSQAAYAWVTVLVLGITELLL